MSFRDYQLNGSDLYEFIHLYIYTLVLLNWFHIIFELGKKSINCYCILFSHEHLLFGLEPNSRLKIVFPEKTQETVQLT